MKYGYAIVATLVLCHCLVAQVMMFQFCEEMRGGQLSPMYTTVQNLASNNSALNDRIERARATVAVVSDENTRLKASLREGVDMLQAEIEENNSLNERLENMAWRIEMLQNTIDRLVGDNDGN